MTHSAEQAELLGILAEAKHLVEDQRRAFRCADFASFLATAVAIDSLTERIRHLGRGQTESLSDEARADVLEVQNRLHEQMSLLAAAAEATMPLRRTYARLPAPKPKSSILLDQYS